MGIETWINMPPNFPVATAEMPLQGFSQDLPLLTLRRENLRLRESRSLYGGFLKWGYPGTSKLSKLVVGFSLKKAIRFGVASISETFIQ